MTPSDRALQMWNDTTGKSLQEMLAIMEQHVVDAVAAEREACARLVEALPAGFGDLNRNDVAARIRARSVEIVAAPVVPSRVARGSSRQTP